MEIAETVSIHTAEAPEPCYICLPPVFSTLFYPCCLMLDFSTQNPPTSTSVPESRQNSRQPAKDLNLNLKFKISKKISFISFLTYKQIVSIK